MNMIKVFTFVSLFAIIGLSNGISQTITTSPVSSPLCAGTAVNVQYHVSSNFNGANLFRAELSDSSGSFITYNVIGVLADSASSIIHAIIPLNVYGTHFRIRVSSSNPAVIGGDNGAPINIVAIPNPIINYTTPLNFCAGDSVVLDAGTGYTFHWNTGSTSNTITVNTSGTYRVTATSFSCSGTASQTVTVYPLPTVNFFGLPAITCSNAGYILLTGTPSGNGGYFSGPGVTNSDFNPDNLSGLQTVTYTYIEAAHSCSNSISHSVIVKAIADEVISSSIATAFCLGNADTLTSLPYASYLWSNNATTQSITVSSAGTYNIKIGR